jgi:hypothetical protein
MNDKQIEERNEFFDSAVREQITGFEPKVPHALWNRISSELDKGEASEEVTPIAEHHERTLFGKWKFAIAAAVLLTLTVGTLLYTLNPNNGINSTSNTIANKANTKTVSQPAVTAPVQVSETKMVAQTTPAMKAAKKAAISTAKVETPTTVASNTTEPATIETNPSKDQVAQDMQLEFAPVTTQNNPVEVGNIPLASLNFLSTPSSLNDEITVIKSADNDKKKKHGKRDEQSTKVIVIGKKFDSKPNIVYQVPVRF